MKTLRYSSQFKKDLKRYRNQPKKMQALKNLLSFLQVDGVIPAEYRPHFLSGKYKGFMECHVEGDLLLIWLNEAGDVIDLVRFGTHSELFKM